ncbi:MAG: hypothetical protein ACRDVP_08275 [Acidimicrobiales bacterium]
MSPQRHRRAKSGRSRLFFLPGYAPQLNADEWAWKNAEHDRIGQTEITSLEGLGSKALAAPDRIARVPALIEMLFGAPDLRYILA